MFKPFLVICTIICLPVFSLAQAEMGIKGGLNISDIVMTNYINPDVESDLSLKLGPHAGVYVYGMLDERVGVAGELLYSNKGVRGISNIHLHYITVPLLLQYRFADRITGELGPEPGYLFLAQSKYGNAGNTYNNKFDLSLDAGVKVNAGKWLIGLRYCAGLFSVRDASASAAAGGSNVKFQNRVLQLSVGYRIWLME